MTNDKSKTLAIKALKVLIAVEIITVLTILSFVSVYGKNYNLIFVLIITLFLLASALFFIKHKKYNVAKYIVIIVPPYSILILSIIEKYYAVFNNTYSYLNPRLFEIIYLMVPVILFGLIDKKRMIISLAVISPAIFLFPCFHRIFGININILINNDRYFYLFMLMFIFFYSVSIVSVLFFQKTSILYRKKNIEQTQQIIEEKKYLENINTELQETKRRFELAQKAGNIGVWEWDVKKDRIYWTKITYRIFGVKQDGKTVKTADFFKIVHPDDVQILEEKLKTALKNNDVTFRTEYRIIKNGEIKYIEEISEIIKNENGDFVKMIGVLQDVTDKKYAENEIKNKNEELVAISEELRQNNEELQTVKEQIEEQYKLLKETTKRYNLLADNINDFIWMLSPDMKPLYLSPSCKKFIGYTSDELFKMNLSDIHPEKSYVKIKKIIASALKNSERSDKVSKLEVEYIHKNGKIITAEIMGSLIYENEKIIGIGGISRDITERKEAEKKLEKINKKLAETYKDLLENIRYAKKIQDALLTPRNTMEKIFNDYFLIFKPRYTVGGDFYYVNKINKFIVFAVGDCTGHGVSGGFLTMTAITYLHEIVRNGVVFSPAQALEILRKRFKRTYRTFGKENADGFNIALCAINTETGILQYSGAYHPLYLMRNKKLTELKETRNPIGYYFKETEFLYHEIKLEKNDKIYLFSDGYYDQINPEGKKIGKKQFKILLNEICHLPFGEQEKKLTEYLENWKQNQYQIDDITVFGITV